MPEPTDQPAKLDETLDAKPYEPPKRKRRPVWFFIGSWIVVLAVAAVTLWYVMCPSRRYYDSSSCANHFIQHHVSLEVAADEAPDYILPSTSDARTALRAAFTAGKLEDIYIKGLDGGGSACPQSFRRDRSIGYVYIGDGLRLGTVRDRQILILFCPGENHRETSEHCHGWAKTDGSVCAVTNAEMLGELERALQRGMSGEVPYSKRAMDVLNAEIAKRKSGK